jgi:Predicted dehydrogenases and related proteins
MIQLALIGLGNMGKLHLNNLIKLNLNKICKLGCICDIDKDLTDKISNRINVKGYYCVEDMIKDYKFDAAIISITSSEHFKVAKLLIEHDKPILIEKPVVISIDEAEELYRVSHEKNILVSPGYTEVYNSVTTGIKNYLKNCRNFNYIDFYRIGQKGKRNNTKDIDVIQDLMTHDLAVLSQIIDLNKIKSIQGNVSSYNDKSKKYDLSNVSLFFENRSIARFLCDRSSSVKIRKFNISNDEMYGEFDFMDQTANIMKKGSIDAFGKDIWYSKNYDAVKIRYSNNPLYDEIKDFILSVEIPQRPRFRKSGLILLGL